MTPEQLRLTDALAVTAKAATRLRDSLRSDGAPLETAIAAEPNHDTTAEREVDAFVQRYQQTVEHVTHRLFGAIYRSEEIGARPPPLRHLLDYLVDIGAVSAAGPWKIRLEIRNRLVHEYPLDPADRARALRDAMQEGFAILVEIDAAFTYVERRKLLEPSHDQ